MKVLLITPPMVQVNTPYPAMPVLCGFLKRHGVMASQVDFSLALALRLFSREGISLAIEAARHAARGKRRNAAATFLLDHADEYLSLIDPVTLFLQGKASSFAWRLSRRSLFPQGPHFAALDEGADDENGNLESEFGFSGITDRAKVFCSLFLDDLADLLKELVDPSFSLARYAEHLALAAPLFDPILHQIQSEHPTPVDRIIDEMTDAALAKSNPDWVGITLPFPGTVYAAFRIAARIKAISPQTKIVLGGGYVNTELQSLSDLRIFDIVDALCFGEGFDPWLGLLGLGPYCRTRTREGWFPGAPECGRARKYEVPVSDYSDLPMADYLSLAETANPMHRLWSDGHWLKVQLAKGCYWHQCAFCDVALEYIADYQPADAKQAVDALVRMRRETGIRSFHFTDEALPPALLRAISEELISRKESIVWWGNIRLDKSFTTELCALMSRAGCIGVSAGLECANDRLLALMKKGITCSSAKTVCGRLADAGILVHVYLMYGFPTQTRRETVNALDFVRELFAEGVIQSAFWHRFALTVHSPIARDPDRFGIRILPSKKTERRFAENELFFEEPGAPDHAALGNALSLAVYNYMQGRGLDLPVRFWFEQSQ